MLGVLGQYPEAGGQSCLAIRTLLLGLCNRCVTFVTSGCVYNGERRGIGTGFVDDLLQATHLIWLRLLSGVSYSTFPIFYFLPLFLLQVCLWPFHWE